MIPVVLAAVLFTASRKQLPAIHWGRPQSRCDKAAAGVLWFFAVLAVCAVAGYTFSHISHKWDAYMIWGFKARVVTTAPVHQADYFDNLNYAALHLNYPLLVPFQMASVNGLSGTLGKFEPKITFVIAYAALGLILYGGARTFVKGRAAGLIAVLGMTSAAVVRWAGSGYADVPLATMQAGVLTSLLMWSKSRLYRHAVMAAIFAAAAAFTKNEGMAWMALTAVAALVLVIGRDWHRRGIGYFLFIGTAAALLTPWLVFRQGLPRLDENYPAHMNWTNLKQQLPRLQVVLPEFCRQCFARFDWSGVWHLLPVSAVLGWRGFRHPRTLFLWILLVGHVGLYIVIYTIGPLDPGQLMIRTLERLILHVLPTALLLIAAHWRQVQIDQYRKRRALSDQDAASIVTPS